MSWRTVANTITVSDLTANYWFQIQLNTLITANTGIETAKTNNSELVTPIAVMILRDKSIFDRNLAEFSAATDSVNLPVHKTSNENRLTTIEVSLSSDQSNEIPD